MVPKLSISKRLVVTLILVIALGTGITIVLLLPYSNTNSLVPTSISGSKATVKLSAQEEDKSIVPLDQIVSGGPPPDGIPSIDNPKFTSVKEADKILEDSELVVGLNVNGDIRAYPLQILVWHEIVNDNVGGVPVAVTYCPLCFTNQVFNRTLEDGNMIEFGTSGKLYNSNLVMYDRVSNSLWSQALAQGIVGKYAGVNLQRMPFDVANWKEWKELYPESKVLSRDTGSSRPYGADPYGDYYTNSEVLFPISNTDNRLGLKEIIIGLENSGQYKAYKLQDVEDKKIINDEISNKSIAVFSSFPFMVRVFNRPVVDGQVLQFKYNSQNSTFIDLNTGSEWNFEGAAINGGLKGKELTRLPFDEGFWFEWVAFHPETQLFKKP
ncbi:MAG: DUF3179 domain-containing protein [Nitrososphaeraceae archaeon]